MSRKARNINWTGNIYTGYKMPGCINDDTCRIPEDKMKNDPAEVRKVMFDLVNIGLGL
jgi:hypothetical protein